MKTRLRILHTLIWAFFATCILAIPLAAWVMRFDRALLLIGIVLLEGLVLAFNAWRCPLSAVAARYTSDRRDNFDIYLPVWLARHNKTIFWRYLRRWESVYSGAVPRVAVVNPISLLPPNKLESCFSTDIQKTVYSRTRRLHE